MRQIRVLKSKATSIQVGCCNWPNEYPYVPRINVDMWHNGDSLFMEFKVAERYTLANVATNNGESWTDSCVEFFIAPDDSGYYYNFEFTCIGKLLLAHRPGREGAELAALRVVDGVKSEASLGNVPFGLIENSEWSLKVEIPISTLFKHNFKSWSQVKAKCNLYKCGNNLPERHFVSYAPIDTPKPDFHRPEFFIPIEFE